MHTYKAYKAPPGCHEKPRGALQRRDKSKTKGKKREKDANKVTGLILKGKLNMPRKEGKHLPRYIDR